MNRCELHCGKNTECVYEVCPFEHEYTYEGEVVSGYRCVMDPVEDRLINTAIEFKNNHDNKRDCEHCFFRKRAVPVPSCSRWVCDYVCKMEVGDIIEYLRSWFARG